MILRSALFAGVLISATSFADVGNSDLTRIRAIGVEIAHALSDADRGIAPSPAQLAQLQREIVAVSRPDLDALQANKLKAMGVAFAQLRDTNRIHASATSNGQRTFTQEVVTHAHGSACANAIGLLVDHPVRVVLGTGADAWFHADPNVGTGLRLITRSNGPDPAIEVFSGCSSNSKRIAQNDDNVGLDASVAVDAGASDVVFVHVINSGEPGAVDLLAAATVGTISGNVRDGKTAQPISNATVNAFMSEQSYYNSVGNMYTDSNGNYTLNPTQTGAIYLVASAQGYLPQLYPSGYCEYSNYYSYYINTCDFSHAQAVNVTATSATKNINFSLSTGARLSGQVRDTENAPLSGTVILSTVAGDQLVYGQSDAAGHYSFPTMPPGQYVVQASDAGYSTQFYDHVDCSGALYQDCNFSSATPITVGSADVTDINFTLQKLSSFTGVVQANGQPVTNAYVNIYVLDTTGNTVGYGTFDDTGHYVTSNVPPGTYYLTTSGGGFYSQLFGGHDCQASCMSELAQGVPLTISSSGQQVEADFNLDPLPSLNGRITDSVTGDPVQNTTVYLSLMPNSTSSSYSSGLSDTSGNYVVSSIQPGSYYVWAQSPDHIDEIYNGIPCEVPNYYYVQTHCDVTGATLITVSAGQATLLAADFALAPSGSITGTATIRAGTGSEQPAMNIGLNLYDNTGSLIGEVGIDAAGHYTLSDLAPGTYFLVANQSYQSEYISQMWQDEDCTTCTPTAATPIVVAQGQTVIDIDFHLTRIDAVVGRVTDAAGNPIKGAVVDLFNTSDKTYAAGAPVDDQGYYAVSGQLGSSYFVATEAGSGYLDQIYSGITCNSGNAYDGHCSFNGATSVSLLSGATQPHIVNFALQVGDRLFANGFE